MGSESCLVELNVNRLGCPRRKRNLQIQTTEALGATGATCRSAVKMRNGSTCMGAWSQDTSKLATQTESYNREAMELIEQTNQHKTKQANDELSACTSATGHEATVNVALASN